MPLIFALMILTFGVLIFGILTMASNSASAAADNNDSKPVTDKEKKRQLRSNKLMVARIVMQSLTILMLFLLFALGR